MMDVPVNNLFTGAAMTSGCDRFVGDTKNPPKGVEQVRSFCLVLFADDAASGSFGALSSIPCSMVPGFYNANQRGKEVNNII